MLINDAIKQLENARESGVKSIVFAYWEASAFDMTDDEQWEASAEYLEENMDWSHTHEDLGYHLNRHNEIS